jgi:hypothetical protein
LQTFVEQKLNFLLREYLGLPVSLYLHPWCIEPIWDLTSERSQQSIANPYYSLSQVFDQ